MASRLNRRLVRTFQRSLASNADIAAITVAFALVVLMRLNVIPHVRW